MSATMWEDCFHRFKCNVSSIALPERFNYPFNYDPHPLCRLAAADLQHHLETQTDWVHDFGIHHPVEGTNIGKMFGVLVVRNSDGELGYLAGFSGKLAGKNLLPGFVPPIVDLLCEDGFYRRGEDHISHINHRIKALEADADYLHLKALLDDEKRRSKQALEQYRMAMKTAKQARDHQREKAQNELSPEQFEALKEVLKNESLKWQYDYKQLVIHYENRLSELQRALDVHVSTLSALKEERKTKSSALQQQMFDLYQFLNFRGEPQGLIDLFLNTEQKTPPAGAGDCAGPKMLQYAYQHRMQPLVMAEFWWGQSPKSEIRKHAHFYPACNSKCKPILGHMMQGLSIDPNPVLLPVPDERKPLVIYDDEAILVVNKPAEYLSVPGKTDAESVYSHILQHYPDAQGPLMVHRLDMSTSGLMVIAKTTQAYHHLQNQFLQRTVKKRYVALLDGLVKEDRGVIDLPLRVDLDDRPRQLVCYDYGKPAVTHFRVLQRVNGCTRIYFFPVTGRTHQLRVHSAHHLGLNCPIVGDDLYGQKANRLHLHAEYLEFVHPISGQVMTFMQNADF